MLIVCDMVSKSEKSLNTSFARFCLSRAVAFAKIQNKSIAKLEKANESVNTNIRLKLTR